MTTMRNCDFCEENLKEFKKMVQELRNPYPIDIFTEITENQWKIITKLLMDNGHSPDRIFGCWGRKVFENTKGDMLKEIENVSLVAEED